MNINVKNNDNQRDADSVRHYFIIQFPFVLVAKLQGSHKYNCTRPLGSLLIIICYSGHIMGTNSANIISLSATSKYLYPTLYL